mmetsp:Transcript_93901/g.166140  ORF Transcript_93901/g.166140 Transcript_93901/m.166140 type:complete len:196 (-) Transcript_93901:84-671(-)
MAKEAFLRAFGYRRCANCGGLSNAGWCDDEGVWHCEECYMNCILDLFSADFSPPARPWLIATGARCAVQIPIVLGYFAWHTGCAACRGASVLGHVGYKGLVGRSSSSRDQAQLECSVLKQEVFDSKWNVIVDPREGRLSVGDPVEVLSEASGQWLRAIVFQRLEGGAYVVKDEHNTEYNVPQEKVRVDKARAPRL